MARVRSIPIAHPVLIALTVLTAGCASSRSASGQLGRGQAALECPAGHALERSDLLRCWGEPSRVERQPSSAPGLGYERWVYGTGAGGPVREAWLAGEQVVDVTVSDGLP
jgi:hypothetical protein